jgi:Flp pilus assembly protein CpaB
MATLASPLSPARTFRPARRVNGRVALGAGLAVLSVLAMVLGLSLVVPETQTVLQATRDLPAGAVIGPDDVTVVKVRVPETMAASAYSGTMADQVVGRRTALRVAAGQLLAPTEFETPHVSVAPGRVQVTIPVDPYTASGGQVGPGDTVVIYASPKQQASIASANILVEQARVLAVGRADAAGAAAGGSAASGSASNRPLWITLDLDETQGAQVAAAARTQYVDVGLVSTGSTSQVR